MVEKIGPVKNPLTIIAIFAGIAEVSGTAILPLVAPSLQATYVWFPILFPVLLVILFFATLNFNHEVLYAPSDFKDENNFFRLLREPTAKDRINKLKEDFIEDESGNSTSDSEGENTYDKQNDDNYVDKKYLEMVESDPRSTGLLAEELVFSKLADEFDEEIKRDTVIDTGKRNLMIDGISIKNNRAYAIEVKYMRGKVRKDVIQKVLDRMESVISTSYEGSGDFELILAIVTNIETERVKEEIGNLYERMESHSFPVDIRVFNLDELKSDAGLL